MLSSLWLLAACGAGGDTAPDTEMPPLPPETPVGESTAIEEEAQAGEMTAPDMSACPTEVERVQVSAEMTSDGAALVFTTDTGDVSELQSRVRMLSQRFNQARDQAGAAPEMGGPDTGQPDTGMSGEAAQGEGMHTAMLRQTRSRVEEIENGARLVIAPDDPAQLSALREHIRMHGAELVTSECPHMQQQQRQAPSGTMTPPAPPPVAPPSPDQPLPGEPIPEPGPQPDPDDPGIPGEPVDPTDPTTPEPPLSPSPSPAPAPSPTP
ncbi:MAG TPA: hypothetical protein VKZ63_00675 [Kofleriaceae bacterium]|nr:hypothetical protein [Kofleriaceae bacterium]